MQPNRQTSSGSTSSLFGGSKILSHSESSINVTSALQSEILESIDRGLDVFGSSVREAIYFHLEKESGISRSEIISNPKKFIAGLEPIFGPGARTIEKHLISNINSQFGISGTTLDDVIAKTKSRIRQ